MPLTAGISFIIKTNLGQRTSEAATSLQTGPKECQRSVFVRALGLKKQNETKQKQCFTPSSKKGFRSLSINGSCQQATALFHVSKVSTPWQSRTGERQQQGIVFTCLSQSQLGVQVIKHLHSELEPAGEKLILQSKAEKKPHSEAGIEQPFSAGGLQSKTEMGRDSVGSFYLKGFIFMYMYKRVHVDFLE